MNKNLAFGLLFALVLILPAVSAQGVFIRGDANSDGKVDISDTAFINKYLFSSGTAPKCLDAADVDDNGKIEITDGVYLNNYLFLGSGKAPPAPYPTAGVDTTIDGLNCDMMGGGASGSVTLSIISSMCNGEYGNARVRGYVNIPDSHKASCKALGSGDYGIMVELYDSDPFFSDYITEGEKVFLESDDCVKVNFDFEITNSEFELGRFLGEAGEGDTLELFARAHLQNLVGVIKDFATAPDSDIQNVQVVDCQCLPPGFEGTLPVGPCCTSGMRPWEFRSAGLQPIGDVDSYYCAGNAIILKNYRCNGVDSKSHFVTSEEKTCGTCTTCIEGERSCLWMDGRETCGTTDCSSKSTACRVYNNKDSFCKLGVCTENTCDSYTDKSFGTSCGANNECDGSGNCINCASSETDVCNDNDEYTKDACGHLSFIKDCGEISCSDIFFPYCSGNELWEHRSCTNRYCSSSRNNRCTSEQTTQEDRKVKTCLFGCSGNQCNPNPNVECFDNLDCPRKYSNPYCSNPAQGEGYVVRDFTDYACENAGAENSYCKEVNNFNEFTKCDCGCSNGACISPCPTCSDGIKNQDETDKDCGGTKCGKCPVPLACLGDGDCQSSFCNPTTKKCEIKPTCTNDCTTAGNTKCLDSTTRQTCGNYDADVCSEWGSNFACQYGCSGDICSSSIPKPDLIITSLVVQYPSQPVKGQDITMAFTIKNIGTTSASSVGWKLDSGSAGVTSPTGRGFYIDVGKSATVFAKLKYTNAGTYNVKAIADYANTISEINEDNNEMIKGVTVK